jgi:hypothetical protein
MLPAVAPDTPRTPSPKEDPVAAGRAGAAAREAKALARIGKARQVLNQSAPRVAKRAVSGALGLSTLSQTEAAMIKDVLDRTVGKAPVEVRVGPADQTLRILQELDG